MVSRILRETYQDKMAFDGEFKPRAQTSEKKTRPQLRWDRDNRNPDMNEVMELDNDGY